MQQPRKPKGTAQGGQYDSTPDAGSNDLPVLAPGQGVTADRIQDGYTADIWPKGARVTEESDGTMRMHVKDGREIFWNWESGDSEGPFDNGPRGFIDGEGFDLGDADDRFNARNFAAWEMDGCPRPGRVDYDALIERVGHAERTPERVAALNTLANNTESATGCFGVDGCWGHATSGRAGRLYQFDRLDPGELDEKKAAGGWDPKRDECVYLNQDGDTVGLSQKEADDRVWEHRGDIIRAYRAEGWEARDNDAALYALR